MTTVIAVKRIALLQVQHNERDELKGHPLVFAVVVLLATVAGMNTAFGQQAPEEAIDIAQFVRTAIPLKEIKGDIKKPAMPLPATEMPQVKFSIYSVNLKRKEARPIWVSPGSYFNKRKSDHDYSVSITLAVHDTVNACLTRAKQDYDLYAKREKGVLRKLEAGDLSFTWLPIYSNKIDVTSETHIVLGRYRLHTRVTHRNPSFVGEEFDQIAFTTKESTRLALLAFKKLEELVGKSPIQLDITLRDEDQQFTMSDRAELVITVSNHGGRTYQDCTLHVTVDGEFGKPDDPAFYFPADGDAITTQRDFRVELRPKTKQTFVIPVRSADMVARKQDSDVKKQWHLDRKTWMFLNLLRAPSLDEKPTKELSVALKQALDVQVIGKKETKGRQEKLYDAKESIHIASDNGKPGAIARITYPDFRPIVGMPQVDEARREYYMKGDIRISQVGNQSIRALAIRAARYGNTWTRNGPPPGNPEFPETPAKVVENIAEFVTDALMPKGAPASMWTPTGNAESIWRREYGFGAPLPNYKMTDPEVGSTFVCQEHAMLLGSLVRALGFPCRDVNVLTFVILVRPAWQDASNDVWYDGHWNYWGLFDYTDPTPEPFRDPDAWYKCWHGRYVVYRGKARFDAEKHNITSRFNIGEGKIGHSHWHKPYMSYWESDGDGTRLKDGRLVMSEQPEVQIDIHSPIALLVELPDGRRFGMTEKPAGDPAAWFFGDQRPGLINEIPGCMYVPENMLKAYPSTAAGKEGHVAPQRLVIRLPDGVAPNELKLKLTATGTGDYRIDLRDVNQQGIQAYQTKTGEVNEGDVATISTGDFTPKGERTIPVIAPPKEMPSAASPTPYLGITTHAIDEILAKSLQVPQRSGVMVGYVESNSPAAVAGLKSFDVVTTINARPVTNRDDVHEIVRTAKKGDVMSLEVKRLGRVEIPITNRPAPSSLPETHGELLLKEDFSDVENRVAERWSDGYSIDGIAGNRGKWHALLSPQSMHELQDGKVVKHVEELEKLMATYADSNWELRHIAHNNHEWAVVFEKRNLMRKQVLTTHKTRKEVYAEIKKRWKQKYQVTAAAHGEARWVLLFTKNSGLRGQSYVSYDEWDKVKEGIRRKWKEDRGITCVARDGKRWLVIFSRRNSQKERWYLGSPKFLDEKVAQSRAEGYRLALVADGSKKWFVVLTKPK